MRDICNYIKEETKSSGSNIYWSVENNTIGESALLVINDFGEDEGPDHKLSADPKMLKEIVNQIKNIKKIFGEKFLGVRKNEENTKIFRRPS